MLRSRSNSAPLGGATPASSSSPPSCSPPAHPSQLSATADTPHVGCMEERLTHLDAHAAVRIDELADKLFDCEDLPKRTPKMKRKKHRALAQTVRKMASFMTTRINPAFQESQLKIEETMEGLYFTVYTTANPPKMTFRTRMCALVDVVSDSVIEKETVVFTEAPGSDRDHRTSIGASRTSTSSPLGAASVPARKGELLSNLIRAYGDIGLLLTFKVSRRDGELVKHPRRPHKASHSTASSVSRRPFTRISIRFVSTADRDAWLSFCLDAYVGLLVDSIRSGVDHTQRDAAVQNTVFATPIAPPSREAVDKYVEFFLSAGGGEEVEADPTADADTTVVDIKTPPGGGLIRVSRVGEVGQLRRLAVEKKGRGHRDCLVMHRTSARQRWKGVKRFSAQITAISVFADDQDTGTNFFLECDRSDKSATEATGPRSATAVLRPRACVTTYELVAKSYAARSLWLRWLEIVTGKPVVYFSQAQQEPGASAQEEEERKAQLFRMDELW